MRKVERRLDAVARSVTNCEPGGSATATLETSGSSRTALGMSGSCAPSAAIIVNESKDGSDQLGRGIGALGDLEERSRRGDRGMVGG